jgi:hypothetical protein
VIRSVTLGLSLAVLPAFAQESGPTLSRDEAFKLIDAYVVSNVQEGLGLDDDGFVKLLPHVKRLQKDRRELARRRFRCLSEMGRLLEGGAATDARLADLLAELRGLEEEEPATLRKDRVAIDALLTPVQQAKYRLLEARVDQRIRELVLRGREERGRARRESTQ